LIDKPSGITSSGVVLRVKRLLKEKVGHGGTLDPNATGLLCLFIGKATKIASYFYEVDKEYIAKARFGIETDTQDIWGKIEKKGDALFLTKDGIEKEIQNFIGEIEQTPPMVSAVHHQGKRLYDLARKGIVVERRKRKIKIYEMDLISFEEGENPEAEFRIRCSGGTYIRTLFSDMGEVLGVGGVMSSLRRVKIGKFLLKDAKTLDELKSKEKKEIESFIIPIQDALYFMESAVIGDPIKVFYRQSFRFEGKDGFVKMETKDGIFLGIGKIERCFLSPIKIIAIQDDLL